jgi:hypothetical protein
VKRTVNIDGNIGELEYPTLKNIPFFTLQNSDYSITVSPKVGDTCLLIFCERNADSFWESGKVSIPAYAPTRRHDINDAVAIGFTPSPKLIKNYGEEGIEIRNAARVSCI